MTQRTFYIRYWLIGGGSTLLILAALYFVCIYAPPFVVSETTTRITGPLTDDGQIDFLKALEQQFYPPELATDDNGFRIFVRQFGNISEQSGSWETNEFNRKQKYKKLGLDPDIPPTLEFPQDPGEIYRYALEAKGEKIENNFFKYGQNVWTLEDYPMLADWIKEIDEPLDAIAEAIHKPVYYVPLMQSRYSVMTGEPENLFFILLPDIQICRQIARLFQTRAAYRIGQGNIDGAIDDKLTIHRLGRHIGQGCPVQHLVGIAIEGTAGAIPLGANPEHPLTKEQVKRLLASFDTLPPRMPIEKVYEWERHFGLSVIQSSHRSATFSGDWGWDSWSLITHNNRMSAPYPLFTFSCNWNIVYRRMNEFYDMLQEPPPRMELQSKWKTVEANTRSSLALFSRLWTSSGRGEQLADVLIALFGPAVDAMDGAVQRMECSENMQRLSWAILLYYLEHDKMPDENWAAQIAQYLGENPEQYSSCPSHPSPRGYTTYALVQYGDTVSAESDLLLLVELKEPVPMNKAIISADEVLERQRTGSRHTGGMNTTHKSGAIRFLSEAVKEEELERLLGR
jgi:hypothetical protein